MTQATPTTAYVLCERYRIEERLGANRLAVVYRAFDERLHRPVLVHMLRKDLVGQEPLRQRFIQEVQASAKRSHQSLLELYDSGDVAGRPFMITEYIAGRAIRDLGPLSLEEALLYLRQLVGAVATAQAAGVAHPPISSRNVILIDDGHVELVESWQTPPNEVALDLAAYRPPERTEGMPATSASAVYALGLLLLEMLSGQRVFTGQDPRVVAEAHTTTQIPTIAEVRPSLRVIPLEQIIAKATARRPEQRYPDAASFGRAVDDLWRTLNSETKRLANAPVQRPGLRERVARVATSTIPAMAASQSPLSTSSTIPQIADDGENFASTLPPAFRQSRRRSMAGLALVIGMVVVAVLVGYSLASFAIEQLSGFQLPRPSLPSASIPSNLPEWLTGVPSGGEDVYVVSGVPDEGLNLRDNPGITTNVIGLLPNGTMLRNLDDPREADGVTWLHVRTRVDEREIEGWVSKNFVKPVTKGT